MSADLDLSVLIPTYNRASEIETTLDHLSRIERTGISHEIVVIDNNSTDSTRETIEKFKDRLPLKYLLAEKAGKNCALNAAIDTVRLGKIVLFTDDDIVPPKDWFRKILDICKRWPDHSVFGGKIRVVMPTEEVPAWTRVPLIANFAFTEHDISPTEGPYPPDTYPFGPNYWLRREVLEKGFRFDERIGPHPTNRILGDEILFLKQLTQAGYEIVYSPEPEVGHRIQPEMISIPSIKRRAVTLGRGGPHISGLCHPNLLKKYPFLWRLLRRVSLFWYHLRYAASFLVPNENIRLRMGVISIMGIWYNRESLRLTEGPQPKRES